LATFEKGGLMTIRPMELAQLQSSLNMPEEIYGNELLSWFGNQESAVAHREEFVFNDKKVFRFCANLSDSIGLNGFGRSLDEQTAAVKACAEAIERTVYRIYLKQNGLLNLKITQKESEMNLTQADEAMSIPSSFHNSNGWAVGFSPLAAIERARAEALERHLLLLTFLKDGWRGFYEISRLTIEGIEFTSLLSKYTLAGYSAGIGIARAKQFNGASFGYICDKSERIKTSPKWEQAFYESFDYIRVRAKLANFLPEPDLISQELHHYLENNFAAEFSTQEQNISLGNSFNSNLAVIDLGKEMDLNFPFFAAVVHGQDLLPLYFKKSLSMADQRLLEKRMTAQGVTKPLPERHPIL